MTINLNEFRLSEENFIAYKSACRFDEKTMLMLKDFIVNGYPQAEVARMHQVKPQFLNNRLKKFINIIERSVINLPEPLKLVSIGVHPTFMEEIEKIRKKSFELALAENKDK